MSAPQRKKQKQLKVARLEIVAEMYKKGNSIRKIQAEVMRRLDLATYGLSTVHRDVQTLLKEWRDSRVNDMDLALQLELERIDHNVRELYEQWDKSKTDYTKTSKKQKGLPKASDKGGEERLHTFQVEQTNTETICLGDPAYMGEIRKQLAERRKLLGLYAPERKELTGKDGKDLMSDPILIEIIDNRDKVDAEDTDN